MRVCDGCGETVDDEHVRRRIERLELATRFRPVHIETLLVGGAPPAKDEDYVYSSEQKGTELQRNGIFLVYAVECPLANGADASSLVKRLSGTFIKRVQFSYKPKSIVLFSAGTAALIAYLREAGLGDRLVLNGGAPFAEMPDLTGKKS